MRAVGASALVAALAGCGSPPGPLQKTPSSARQLRPVVVVREAPAEPGSLRLASLFPTVGRYARSGTESHRGARLAVEDVLAAGGIHGRSLHLVEYETGSYFLDAREAAREAVEKGALALVGSNASALSEAVAEVAETTGTVQVSNVSTAPDLTWDPTTGRDRPYVFRMCGSDELMGTMLAEFARGALHARRAAALYEVGRGYSANLAKSFLERFREAEGAASATELVYLPLETDFRPQLRQAAAFRPDVLLVPGSFTDATLVAIQARRLGFGPVLLGGDGWSSPLLFRRAGPKVPAFYANHCALPEEFARRYRARFHEDSEGCRAVLAYDAVRAVATALSALGPLSDAELADTATLRRRLRDRLAAVRAEGVSGPIRFDERGDVERGIAITEVAPEDGRYVARHFTWLRTRS
jgi:branched-chain amino acid transport system substrate-binding protein